MKVKIECEVVSIHAPNGPDPSLQEPPPN